MRTTAIKQTISWWCYERSGPAPEQLVKLAAEIGYRGFDLVDQRHWPLIKEHGLEIAAVNGHASIADGLNRTTNHDRIEREISANLELARKWEPPGTRRMSGRSSYRPGIRRRACARRFWPATRRGDPGPM